jgi:pyruvate dehydrogenase E2 component (dihydrolipoamide acetyltransferase)
MATAVMMPQVGQDIETATIVEWHKKENDTVNTGDVIATVESDKATFDVEAYDSGVLLKRLYKEGQEVKVLTPIAYLGQPGDSVDEASSSSEAPQADVVPDSSTSTVSLEKSKNDTKVIASPSARRLAKEKGIDLSEVTGTGPGGRITTDDVLKVFGKTEIGGTD